MAIATRTTIRWCKRSRGERPPDGSEPHQAQPDHQGMVDAKELKIAAAMHDIDETGKVSWNCR